MVCEDLQDILEREPPTPLFLFLQFSDLQWPCMPPEPFNTKFASPELKPQIDAIYQSGQLPVFNKNNTALANALYDGAAAYLDSWLERTLALLEQNGLTRENTLFVLFSDHGEELFDKHPNYTMSYGCGRSLYDEQIHVPLMISAPGLNAKTVASPVQLTGIAATIMDCLKQKLPQDHQPRGRSFIEQMRSENAKPPLVFSGGNHGRVAVTDGTMKYITSNNSYRSNRQKILSSENSEPPQILEEVYNLKTDPAEHRNMAALRTELVQRWRPAAQAYLAGQANPQRASSSQPASQAVAP